MKNKIEKIKKPKGAKRLVIVSDFHCGHKVGLTPPKHDAVYPNDSPEYEMMQLRRQTWRLYAGWLEALKPIDVLLVNGDAIEGKGPRSGGTELLTTDRKRQTEMAVDCILEAEAPAVLMSYGTPYHTGASEDWEDAVATDLDTVVKIGSHDWLDLNGLVFDYRHHVGRSSIPHGRHTAPARERLWGLLWAERGEYPKGDIFIRSHVHYHAFCGGKDWLAMTTPALQGYGSKFGTRIASGTVDFGLVFFDVVSKEDYVWGALTAPLKSASAVAVKL